MCRWRQGRQLLRRSVAAPGRQLAITACKLSGAASIAATDKDRAKKFTQALWDADVPSSLVFRYYDGLLYMMCMLHASGEFQAIMPK